jgi:perosamine synthetase
MPVRSELLPYGRQWIDDTDIRAVTDVLRSPFLTTGPTVQEFENAFAAEVGSKYAVAVSSGTAALHAMMAALDVGPGDEVIVPAITFAASANCALYQGARPIFCDVDPETLLIDVEDAERLITSRTKAVVAVDYAGQPCDYGALRELCARSAIELIVDACHSLGGSYEGERVGTLGVMNSFSLHPVKAMTTGEGGMVSTDDSALASVMRRFRNHGLDTDHNERSAESWRYDMVALGYNYRLTDIGCALGLTQLQKLPGWIARRNEVAHQYTEAFAGLPNVEPLSVRPGVEHAYHLYVLRFDLNRLSVDRSVLFRALRAEGIGVNVHYLPVYLHPHYQRVLGTRPGHCPNAEEAYGRILSLPMFPAMTDRDVADTVEAVRKVVVEYGC